LEGLLTAIEVVPDMQPGARLLVVGDGPARAEVEAAADRANSRTGRRAVVLTGELVDPRPAYAAADVAIGMGGSALRAMAFGKPLIVQGERGFWELLRPGTLDQFLWTGWYGVGRDPTAGAALLADLLGPLLMHPQQRETLGQFSLSTATERFSLQRAAQIQLDSYIRAVGGRASASPFHPASDLRAGVNFVGYKTRRGVQRALGRGATDDFNARPVASRTSSSPAMGSS
ncbi:MAG: glycosyltransferase family 4 protein, partial [Actinomycetia bacterium]|nr:glycosyltransferase family 4 protein [Actinomycetes bacterium]